MSQKYFLVVIMAAWWLTVALALPLWLPFLRTFPCVPAFDFVPTLPIFFHIFFLVIQLLASIGLLISSQYRFLCTGTFVACFLVLVLADINRLQPYFYFELFLLLITVFTSKNDFVTAMRIVFGACYFWAGIHKINPSFVPSMTVLFKKVTFIHLDFFTIFLPLVPYIEILIGVAFLGVQNPKGKKMMYVAAILVHLSIIFLLVSARWNKIVLPWNFAMLLVLVPLYQIDNSNNVGNLTAKKSLWACFVMAVCLPFANLWGYWDNYLAWRLYACQPSDLRWYATTINILSPHTPPHLLEKYKILLYDNSKKQYYIDFEAWLLAETHTLPYPQSRYLVPTIRQLLSKSPQSK
jgi:hypothetical protein